MMKLRLLLAVSVVLVLGVVGSSAFAADSGSATCSGGAIAAGTYAGLTVTGTCWFSGGTVTINGNLVVADGAVLNDHAATTATVKVSGNVSVGNGAILGLGSYNPFSGQHTEVGGNIVADQPLSLYLSFLTVHGSLISNGGGGADAQGRNFPTKDVTVDRNLILQGWSGGWIGAIRDHVGGNLIFSNNTSVVDPDSSEVQTNVIGGNLICQGNSPAAQVNPDDGGQPNTVGGHKVGQCAGL
jgi:hypothetical protein